MRPAPDKARTFSDLHRQAGCFLMPNAWDAGSARMFEAAGCVALATTSAGIAFSMGRPDHHFGPVDAGVSRDAMLDRIGTIAESTSLPVNADLESGYGTSPAAVAETIREAIAAGAAGGNIEDFTGERDAPLFEASVAVERIRAARAAIDASGIPFVLVARTDCYLVGHPDPLRESVRRANLYREAGADCLFIPGASDTPTLRALVQNVNGPLSVVMGLTGNAMTVAELGELGVRRVSIGASLARAMYYRIQQAAREMLDRGTFSYADAQLPQEELNRIFESFHAR